MLSWREKNGKIAVNLFIIGKLGQANLASSASEYGDPVYRLELIIDQETTMAIQNILMDGSTINSVRCGRCGLLNPNVNSRPKPRRERRPSPGQEIMDIEESPQQKPSCLGQSLRVYPLLSAGLSRRAL